MPIQLYKYRSMDIKFIFQLYIYSIAYNDTCSDNVNTQTTDLTYIYTSVNI